MRGLATWFHLRFRAGLQYRAAAWASVVTGIVFGIARCMVLVGFYSASDHQAPMTLGQAIAYVWMGQILFRLMPFGDSELANEIRTGTVVYSLLKPQAILFQYYVRGLSTRFAMLVLRVLPYIPLVYILPRSIRMPLPASLEGTIWWVLSLGGALLLASSINCVMNFTSFWTIRNYGLIFLIGVLSVFFGGLIVPLPLLTEGAQAWIYLNPFAGLSDLPSRLYMGLIPASQGYKVILCQLGWTGACLGLAQIISKRGLKRLVAQGG